VISAFQYVREFMRVLHVINGLGSGGAERLLTWLLPGLVTKSVTPEVFALSKESPFFLGDLEKAGIKVRFSKIRKLYSPLQIIAIRKVIVENKYDLVHVHLFPAQLWCSIAISRTRIPLVTTEHNTSNRRRNKVLFKPIDSYMYSKIEKVICISRGTRQNLCKWVPRICNKTTVIYNGIDVQRFSEAIPYERDRLIPDLAMGDKVILMVSRFSPQKDQDTLVRALALLPEQFHVVFVGDGDRKKNVEYLTNSLHLSKRVHFLGNRDDVPRIMKTADVLVQSSHWEGFGLTVVEAMATGLPVIASDVSGVTEIVNGYGSVFQPGNHVELAGGISECLQNKTSCKTLSQINKAVEKFTLEHMVENYLQIYGNIVTFTSQKPKPFCRGNDEQ